MAFVIAEPCIDCKDASCVDCCPVDCIYEGLRTFYIHPEECINCGICVSVCPPEAIFEDAALPQPFKRYIAINRDYFSAAVSGLGSPGGASIRSAPTVDHPEVAQHPRT